MWSSCVAASAGEAPGVAPAEMGADVESEMWWCGVVEDALQILGAVLVLVCFLLAQADRVNPSGYRYLTANLVGSTVMTVTAVMAHEWGFVFLEGMWASVSAWGLVRRVCGHTSQAVS